MSTLIMLDIPYLYNKENLIIYLQWINHLHIQIVSLLLNFIIKVNAIIILTTNHIYMWEI